MMKINFQNKNSCDILKIVFIFGGKYENKEI